jgi:hypothetical protein
VGENSKRKFPSFDLSLMSYHRASEFIESVPSIEVLTMVGGEYLRMVSSCAKDDASDQWLTKQAIAKCFAILNHGTVALILSSRVYGPRKNTIATFGTPEGAFRSEGAGSKNLRRQIRFVRSEIITETVSSLGLSPFCDLMAISFSHQLWPSVQHIKACPGPRASCHASL